MAFLSSRTNLMQSTNVVVEVFNEFFNSFIHEPKNVLLFYIVFIFYQIKTFYMVKDSKKITVMSFYCFAI